MNTTTNSDIGDYRTGPTPTTLDEAIDILDRLTPPEDKAYFLANPDAAFHFSTGMAIRNAWGLWDKESPLYWHFARMGIYHADDMSGIIFAALRARLTGKPFDLEAKVEEYKAFWAKGQV